MAEQHEKALVPQIRFAGFADPWEQRKLDEVASKRIEKNTNGIKETFTNSAEHGIVSQLDYFDHDITNDANIGNYSVVYPDDFVYNPRISTIAPCGPINRNKLGRNGVMSPLYTVFSVDDVINKLYLEHYFKTNRWHQFMFLEGNSGARSDRFSISDSTFFEMPIQCPVLEEQELIASFFDRLDTLITLHQRKYDKLCVLKKSMLDKMFPKGGSLYPEIRFAGFTDPWEQRKLGELYQKNDERNTDGLGSERTLSVASMTFNSTGNGADESSLPNYKRLQLGDIAFEGHANKEFAYGRFVLNDAGNGIMSPRFTCLRPIVEQEYSFWKYFIHSEKVMRPILVNSTKSGTMMNELVVEDFLEQEILVPSLPEQHQIGAFFNHLDSLITLHQRKLELLRNIKKSMLDKMFV